MELPCHSGQMRQLINSVSLRREWTEALEKIASLAPDVIETRHGESLFRPADESRIQEAQRLVDAFLDRLRAIRVLDPACGSGNFLYVTLRMLKELEKEILIECRHRGLREFELQVGPNQLFGIEINPYAFDLAQMTVWIGFIQWQKDNGFPIEHEPILQSLHNFELKDAIIDLTDPANPAEPDWPDSDFIIGNPPFLGDKKMRGELGDEYVTNLRAFYADRIPGQSDLCCYWFEKAKAQIQRGKAKRAGLLATQGIRGGANRAVLERIKQMGDIFFAISDRDWVLDGANVHVSMVGFDDATEASKSLDGVSVISINSQLSAHCDLSLAKRLAENAGKGFIGIAQKAPFDVPDRMAVKLLLAPNPNGRPNSDVLRPMFNAKDMTQRTRRVWNVDFGLNMPLPEASCYEAPFDHVQKVVYPLRINHREARQTRYWWLFARPCPDMRAALVGLRRYLVTPRVSKHRVFAWLTPENLCDSALVVFARSDDYHYGVLHSRIHEVWARRLGTQVRERESGFRYTPSTCFETFPFPRPNATQEVGIAQAARHLEGLRSNWLNPPSWLREEILQFPGSVDGPWSLYVHEPDATGIGTVRYPRLVAKDAHVFDMAKRTLTRLYNERPTWLDLAHKALDEAVFDAYGWDPSMTDEQIQAALLKLNLERSASSEAVPSATEADDPGEEETE